MSSKIVSCTWCSKNVKKHSITTVKSWRDISSKRYQWIHQLIEQRGTELGAEMIICNKCRIMLYKSKKRRETANGYMPLLDEAEENHNININEETNDKLNNLLNLEGFYGDGNDEEYCSWCLKTGTETILLSAVERMLLFCDYKIYCSSNARRCTNRC
jgi:hypothetical protein